MQEQQLVLRTAALSDVDQIGALAQRIWHAHYTPIIGAAQVNYMLRLMYSPDSLTEQMTTKGHLFYLIEHGGQTLGFVSLHETQPGDWFLNKFYVLSDHAGRGLGSLVLQQIHQRLKPRRITLTVNRQNYKSINFYFKNGFRIARVADFPIGEGYVMNDFVMEWSAGNG